MDQFPAGGVDQIQSGAIILGFTMKHIGSPRVFRSSARAPAGARSGGACVPPPLRPRVLPGECGPWWFAKPSARLPPQRCRAPRTRMRTSVCQTRRQRVPRPRISCANFTVFSTRSNLRTSRRSTRRHRGISGALRSTKPPTWPRRRIRAWRHGTRTPSALGQCAIGRLRPPARSRLE